MKRYDVLPAKDHWRCWVSKLGGHSGPTLAQPATTAAPLAPPSADDAEQQPRGGSAGTGAAAARRRLLLAAGGEGAAGVSPKRPKFTPEQLKNLGFVRGG